MRKILPALLLCAMSPAALAAMPFKGANCDLKDPPAAAGEELAQGATVRVFPRLKDMGKAYTGCQLTWMGPRALLGVSYFEKGVGVGFWSPDPNETTCRYVAGKATGEQAAQCPPQKGLAVRSMPAGCARKILGRAGREGCESD